MGIVLISIILIFGWLDIYVIFKNARDEAVVMNWDEEEETPVATNVNHYWIVFLVFHSESMKKILKITLRCCEAYLNSHGASSFRLMSGLCGFPTVIVLAEKWYILSYFVEPAFTPWDWTRMPRNLPKNLAFYQPANAAFCWNIESPQRNWNELRVLELFAFCLCNLFQCGSRFDVFSYHEVKLLTKQY